MMVIMAMALLTTSHGIGIHINTRAITSSSLAFQCNGLTDTACQIAHSELDFDLELMLDSEFSMRILQASYQTPVQKVLDPTYHMSCNRLDNPESCHGEPNNTPIAEHCTDHYNRACHIYP